MDDAILVTTHTTLRNALGDVEDLASAKGLEQAFTTELRSLRRSVEAAIHGNDADAAHEALRDARLLWGLLRGTPGRHRAASLLA